MNKESVILTKWVKDSNTLLEDYAQLALLLGVIDTEDLKERREIELGLGKIDRLLTKSPVGTKWKLTLEKVEE